MAGYKGYSMSNNAVDAYEQGEMPLSKWTKAAMLEIVEASDELSAAQKRNLSFAMRLTAFELAHLNGRALYLCENEITDAISSS